jgi:predicted transcriptional regulator
MKSTHKEKGGSPVPASAQNITLRLQPEKLRGLDALAKRLGITRSAVIQIAIAEKLERENKPL